MVSLVVEIVLVWFWIGFIIGQSLYVEYIEKLPFRFFMVTVQGTGPFLQTSPCSVSITISSCLLVSSPVVIVRFVSGSVSGSYVGWPDVLFYPDMSSFRDPKNWDFASLDICVSLGLSQTNYYALTSFGKGISLMFHLLAQALTVERTVVARCKIIILQIRSLWYDTSPFPLVALFTIAHDICSHAET